MQLLHKWIYRYEIKKFSFVDLTILS